MILSEAYQPQEYETSIHSTGQLNSRVLENSAVVQKLLHSCDLLSTSRFPPPPRVPGRPAWEVLSCKGLGETTRHDLRAEGAPYDSIIHPLCSRGSRATLVTCEVHSIRAQSSSPDHHTWLLTSPFSPQPGSVLR